MVRKRRELEHDPTAKVIWHRPDDRFVPVRACELIDALTDDALRFALDRREFEDFVVALRDVIEQEAIAFERQLADLYATFNPDRDTHPVCPLESLRTPQAYQTLLRELEYLLQKANFQRLSELQIEAAVRAANTLGLRVRLCPELIEHLEVWVRGLSRTRHERRTLRHPIRGESRTLPLYRRIVVIARLRDDPHVIIKIFKDIPQADVEALLPHARVTMTWRDRLLVAGGGAGTLGSTATKVFKLATTLATLKLAWIVLFGAGAVTVRTFLGYRRARTLRSSQRARNLYYQNLSNNSGALQTLIAMTAQEELKEALLGYVFCHQPANTPASPANLAKQVADYFNDRFGVSLCFDAPDAIESLQRLKLCENTHSLRVVPCAEATRRLRDHWNHKRSVRYHLAHACGSPAETPSLTKSHDPPLATENQLSSAPAPADDTTP